MDELPKTAKSTKIKQEAKQTGDKSEADISVKYKTKKGMLQVMMKLSFKTFLA